MLRAAAGAWAANTIDRPSGARRNQAKPAVAKAAHRQARTSDTNPAAPYEVMLDIGALPAGSAGDAEVLVALTQNAVRVDVKRGENAGKVLEHTAVARQLVVAGPTPASGGSLKTSLVVPSGVLPKDLRVVAFVQERASRRILGTATRDLEVP